MLYLTSSSSGSHALIILCVLHLRTFDLVAEEPLLAKQTVQLYLSVVKFLHPMYIIHAPFIVEHCQ